MEKTTKLFIIIGISIAIIGLSIGVSFIIIHFTEEDDDEVSIVNRYDNTEELSTKFPVKNKVTVLQGIEEKIQNRLLTGFENWNRGFKAWKKWGEILYTENSIYNVHGARLTLAQYQKSMDITLKRTNILMGDFHNIIINGDYTAIYYDITTINGDKENPGTVMEFVKFKDYGGDLGTRVVEGWGGTKDESYTGMTYFQKTDEKNEQNFQNLQFNESSNS